MSPVDLSIIDLWYGSSVPVSFDGLLEFSYISNELTKEVIETPIYIDELATTPYMKDGKCFLPALYYTKDFYKEVFGIDKRSEKRMIETGIAIINGSQIHESLHHKLLGADATIISILKKCGRSTQGKYQTEGFKDCLNIVEDIFSNYYCSVAYPYISPFVDLLNEIYFSDETFIYRQNQVILKSNFENVMNFLACFKNKKNYSGVLKQFSEKYQKHIEILKEAANESLDLNKRVVLAERLYDLLAKEHREDSKFSMKSLNTESVLDQNGSEKSGKEEGLVRSIEEDLESVRHEFEAIKKEDGNEQVPVTLLNINDLRNSGATINIDSKFAGFSQYLKQARAEKQIYTEPRYTGNRLLPSRLFMAESDGKIFGKRDRSVLQKGEPEIIILIDCSGSMYGKLLDKTIDVGYTVCKDMRENNIRHAFYGHTTASRECVVYAISAFNMSLIRDNQPENNYDYKTRFEKMHSIECRSNADGYAIEFVGKRFSEQPGKKALIVLSDGQPAFTGYGGNSAVKHVQSVVKNLRDSDISVLSFSLIQGVVKTNNEIYGKKHNVIAYGDNFQENMKKVIADIVV